MTEWGTPRAERPGGATGINPEPPFAPPIVDELRVRVVVDSVFDQFMPKATHPLVAIEHVSRFRGRENLTLAGEWGLSLHLETRYRGISSRYLLDFGYTPEILLRNADLLGIEVEKLNGLILSHGHRDHFGGLAGFVAHHRSDMCDDIRLYAGGAESFREKFLAHGDEEPRSWGAVDRAGLEAAGVACVRCDGPTALDGPFTTGHIARTSFERVLPNTFVLPTPADHFTPEERRGRFVPDKHPDEHATCFIVKGRGLVVVSSCSHCGVVNAVRQAIAVSGVGKVHAVLGGFHLGVAEPDYLDHALAEFRALDPDVVIPMHCTGRRFIAKLREAMPERLVDWNTGSRFTFGA